jgi:hypothetical protein
MPSKVATPKRTRLAKRSSTPILQLHAARLMVRQREVVIVREEVVAAIARYARKVLERAHERLEQTGPTVHRHRHRHRHRAVRLSNRAARTPPSTRPRSNDAKHGARL